MINNLKFQYFVILIFGTFKFR